MARKGPKPFLVEDWIAEQPAGDQCWLWPKALNKGYGVSKRNMKQTFVHRVVYELLVGPIPEGLHLDHDCHTRDTSCRVWDQCEHRRCANPRHLKPVTPGDNAKLARNIPAENAQKTHCANGHPLTGGNLYIYPSGKRCCRTCNNESHWRRRYRKG
jgi:hypothetical protein